MKLLYHVIALLSTALLLPFTNGECAVDEQSVWVAMSSEQPCTITEVCYYSPVKCPGQGDEIFGHSLECFCEEGKKMECMAIEIMCPEEMMETIEAAEGIIEN
mmetsp:Transcript_10922/g.16102  ORF Transcript_10922/g.16102 Transcript_10922/m.16102 type:complete len:103 (+) Transcript_10922:116-424(+)|eukprot:CAMPEP_0194202082 /NCGR_PEP_ID=MMETSP0156-20130528/2191_1 /TAXON_ID=33649 /ORGANISM="Thalassionema nitzschioides, Strain L26-B" /LENGTH=102 /DNA_ID=CAMNT_0038927453 /DNA_START=33 /DNA_END=341 /DNA_ORIENTATION=+